MQQVGRAVELPLRPKTHRGRGQHPSIKHARNSNGRGSATACQRREGNSAGRSVRCETRSRRCVARRGRNGSDRTKASSCGQEVGPKEGTAGEASRRKDHFEVAARTGPQQSIRKEEDARRACSGKISWQDCGWRRRYRRKVRFKRDVLQAAATGSSGRHSRRCNSGPREEAEKIEAEIKRPQALKIAATTSPLLVVLLLLVVPICYLN
mmetsp:Transcript_26019/g.72587  ORF Transcript_26019/g.72587 Transcript_26019/m.72587 type:complete len:209 (-) Transcript_26019:44-670(-)